MADPYQDEANRIRREAALKRLQEQEDRVTASRSAAAGRRRVDMPGGGYAVVNAGSDGLTPDEMDAIRADPRYAQRSQGSPIPYQKAGEAPSTYQPPSRSMTFDLAPMREQHAYNTGEGRRQGETKFNVDEAIRGDVGSSGGQLNLAKAGAVTSDAGLRKNQDTRSGQVHDTTLPGLRAKTESGIAAAALEKSLLDGLNQPAGPSGMGGTFDAAATKAGVGSNPMAEQQRRAALENIAVLRGGDVPDYEKRAFDQQTRQYEMDRRKKADEQADLAPILALLPALAAKNPKMAAAVAKNLPMFQKYGIDPESVFSEDVQQAITAPAVQSAVISAQAKIKQLVADGAKGISTIPFIRLIQRQDFPLNPQERAAITAAHTGIVQSLTARGVPDAEADREATRLLSEAAGPTQAEMGGSGENMGDMIRSEIYGE